MACEKLAIKVAEEYFSQLIHGVPHNLDPRGFMKQKTQNVETTGNEKGIHFFSPADITVQEIRWWGRHFEIEHIQKHLNAFGLKAEAVTRPERNYENLCINGVKPL